MDPKDIFDKDFGNAQGEQYQYDENNKTIPELEQELTNKYHFKGMDDTKELYYYDEDKGIYVKGGECLMKKDVSNMIHKSAQGMYPTLRIE